MDFHRPNLAAKALYAGIRNPQSAFRNYFSLSSSFFFAAAATICAWTLPGTGS